MCDTVQLQNSREMSSLRTVIEQELENCGSRVKSKSTLIILLELIAAGNIFSRLNDRHVTIIIINSNMYFRLLIYPLLFIPHYHYCNTFTVRRNIILKTLQWNLYSSKFFKQRFIIYIYIHLYTTMIFQFENVYIHSLILKYYSNVKKIVKYVLNVNL